MAQSIEIAYYNTVILAGGPLVITPFTVGLFHVEESRIKGGFNDTKMDYGVKAYLTDEDYSTRRRSNAMIYSGIYNSKTKVNKTNEFPIGAAITRAVDLSNGSIQKLHAEDTNLNILQENKVSRALIDKDAIFTAEGQALSVSGSKVIGQVVAYQGKYGISKNPESFAHYGGRKYFVDKNRGVVCRLTRDGITPISMYGMKDFFKDNLALVGSNFSDDHIYGMYDENKDQYVVSLQNASINIGKKTSNTGIAISTDNTEFATLSYSEAVKGWTSFYSYKPTFGLSMSKKFYTFSERIIHEHYVGEYNKFYDTPYSDPSYIQLVFNDGPSSIKTFHTINYEGTTGWSMESFRAENVSKEGYTSNSQSEQAYKIPKNGVTIIDETGRGVNVGFELKESKYYKELMQRVPYAFTDTFHRGHINTTSGIKGYHAVAELQYWEPTTIVNEEKAELFAVSSEINISSK